MLYENVKYKRLTEEIYYFRPFKFLVKFCDSVHLSFLEGSCNDEFYFKKYLAV